MKCNNHLCKHETIPFTQYIQMQYKNYELFFVAQYILPTNNLFENVCTTLVWVYIQQKAGSNEYKYVV